MRTRLCTSGTDGRRPGVPGRESGHGHRQETPSGGASRSELLILRAHDDRAAERAEPLRGSAGAEFHSIGPFLDAFRRRLIPDVRELNLLACLGRSRKRFRPFVFRATQERRPMRQAFHRLAVPTRGRGLNDKTAEICGWVSEQGIDAGLLTIWCRHTSASLWFRRMPTRMSGRTSSRFFARWRRKTRRCTGIARKARTICRPISVPRSRAVSSRSLSARPPSPRHLAGHLSFEHRAAPHRRQIVLHLLGEPETSSRPGCWTARSLQQSRRPGQGGKRCRGTRKVQASENAADRSAPDRDRGRGRGGLRTRDPPWR